MKIEITSKNEDRLKRDIDAIAEAWNYDQESGISKIKFVENQLEDYLKNISRSLRLTKAREAVTIED